MKRIDMKERKVFIPDMKKEKEKKSVNDVRMKGRGGLDKLMETGKEKKEV